ncbi:MAG: hypothetical protein AAF411_08050 [Myxococcota bacterium]
MNRHARLAAALLTLVGATAFSSVAEARCRIRNTTSHSFTLSSGNTSNQRVGANTSTSIDDGEITGRSDDGTNVGGYCADGQTVVIRERNGSIVIAPE